MYHYMTKAGFYDIIYKGETGFFAKPYKTLEKEVCPGQAIVFFEEDDWTKKKVTSHLPCFLMFLSHPTSSSPGVVCALSALSTRFILVCPPIYNNIWCYRR